MNKSTLACVVFVGVAAFGSGIMSAAETQSGTSRIAEQARFWEERGRYDLANDSWKKILRVDPDNAEALTALGVNKAGAGESGESQQYLNRLQKSDPGNPGVERIQQGLTTDDAEDAGNKEALVKARKLSRDKDYAAAVAAYREYYDGAEPTGRLGMEFYQTLAGTEDGWEEAEAGLERLRVENPRDTQYQLAYAEHLTYREKTRRDGIQKLAELESRPAVGAQARASRRQALVWLNAQQSDVALYNAYLEDHPDDSVVKNRLAQIKRDRTQRTRAAAPAPRQPARAQAPQPLPREDVLVKQGFETLNSNRLDEAENLFRQALDLDSNNAGALGGIGIIRLRTERFEEAKQLLQRATRAQPRTASRWREALQSATFWSKAREAQAAREDGRVQQAAALYSDALDIQPSETVVRVSYADTLVAISEYDLALKNYRRALREDPDNSDAQRGVVTVLSEQGKSEEALAFADQIPESQRGQIGGLSNLRAQSLRESAEQAQQQGDLRRAEALLRDALALDPDNSYIRLDLARLYRKLGERDKASSLADGLLASEGNLPDALFIKALIVSEEQKWWDGLQLLERVPPRQRSQAMRDLQERLWVRYETERAVAYAREGQVEGAQQILASVEQVAGEDPEALGALAQAYAEAGQPQRAMALMRAALSGLSDPSPGLRLQYAGLLSKVGQDVEFAVQLDALRRLHGQLSADQRQGLADLEAGNAIRQADRLREVGRFADAYEYLRPHLEINPEDPALLQALARLYGDFKEPDRALNIYYDLLEDHPENLDIYDGAIRAALDADRPDEAQYLVDRALDLAPANPRLYVLAGRLARARGADDQAVSLFKQALALDAENSAEGLGGGGAQSRSPLYLIGEQGQQRRQNPFGESRALRYEQRNLPLGPRAPVGEIPPAGFRRSSANEADYRYSLPDKPERQSRIPSRSQSVQEYRVPRQSPAPVYEVQQPRRTAQPRVAQPRTPNRNAYEYDDRRFSAPARPETATRSVAEVRVPERTRNYQPALQPRRLVRRRLDGPMRPEALPARSSGTPRGQIVGEIADIEASNSNWAAGGLALRNRDGQSGLGELLDIETPFEGSLAEFGPGRVRARVVPVFLDAGNLAGADAQNFGALPIAEAEGGAGTAASVVSNAGTDYDQSESGVAVGMVYELSDWRFDLGSTPLGFPEENIVGGIQWSPRFSETLLNVDISRRAVTDSLLSYAGTEDPFLNGLASDAVTFGGVTRNGGRLDIANDQGHFGIYGNAGLYLLEGEQVEDNTQLELGGGYYQHLWKRENNQFTVGLNVTTFFYDKNLSGFTLGHGGYFSPQFYASVGVPIEWVGRESRFSYRLGGSLGIQSFSEDDEDIFPGNFGGAQTRLETAGGLNGDTRINGESNTGLGFNIFGAAEYLLTPHLSLGANGSFDNAKDFDQLAVSAYLRYWFRPQRPERLPPPRVLAPFYAGDPSW